MTTPRNGYDGLPSVEGALNYLAPMAETPFNYVYDPPPGMPRTNAVYDERRLPIRDARSFAYDASLDREGFALHEQRSAMQDFHNEGELRRVYYPEMETL